MGQVLHGSATMTAAVRRAIQHSQESLRVSGQAPRDRLKEATVKRYHYDSHQELEAHLTNFIDAYNYGRRLKTLKGLTPYEYICKIWTNEAKRFNLNPIHQMPGLNT